MTQLIDLEELKGKTIAELVSDGADVESLIFVFTDNSFVVIESEGYYGGTSSIIIDASPFRASFNKVNWNPPQMKDDEYNQFLIRHKFKTESDLKSEMRELEEARQKRIEENRPVSEKFPTLHKLGIVE